MYSKLKTAVLLGDLKTVKIEIINNKVLSERDELGRTILYDAIVKGFDEIVQVLCNSGIDVNTCDKDGKTPLHFSAIHFMPKSTGILLGHGAKVDATGENGNTPLSDAVFYSKGRAELINLLMAKGANPNLKNNYGISPKELAESIANFDVSYLLS